MMFMSLFTVFSVFFHISDSAINPQRTQLSCAQIKQFVDGHNVRRQQVARGAVPRQPTASNMKYMVWDDELAEKAASRAEHGIFGHSQTIVESQRWSQIGENMFINNIPEPSHVPNIEETLDFWFDEHTKYNFEPYGLTLPPGIGHYTQMVWAESTHVGCGIAQKKEDGWTTTMIICHYGPAGNILGQVPYKSNGAARHLRCVNRSCDNPYGRYCT
ncbi:scoloptoxin SSD552-like [Leguminivora glycinivorella]|uniref:scoloptoxin SSD552-like n=1 Tax=Leguminivora glycinivorella TaxID=1035111 RepID=UPI00200FCF82|nr:scoloptoxin SSD552-like [Leguminivora glycinivorella]